MSFPSAGNRIRGGVLAAVLPALLVVAAPGQEAALWMRSSGQALAVESAAAPAMDDEIVKVLDDPHTGYRWLLMRNAQYPAGPGRLVRTLAGSSANRATAATLSASPVAPQRLIVRSGETIVVRESTPVVEATLEAVALGNAQAGRELLARLRIGGRLIRVRASAPGRADFVADAEVKR